MIPKASIHDFITSVKSQKAPGNYHTSGLIIRKKGTNNLGVSDIGDSLPEYIFLEVDEGIQEKILLEHFKKALEEKKWLFIYLADGNLSKLLREQLSRLKDSNTVFIQGQSVDDTFFGNLPDQLRIVVLIDEENIVKVDYPQFLGLFGPIIEV